MKETGSYHGKEESITTSGTKEEMDDLRAMLNGACWLRMKESEVHERVDRFVPLPPADADPMLPPVYSVLDESERKTHYELDFQPDPSLGGCSSSFYLTSLCGYGWTKSNYALMCGRVQSLGFECLRSRRGRDGRFWEVWYLPGLWAAKGDLKDFASSIGDKTQSEKSDAVVSWCCRHLSFGSMEVTVQRAAMTID